MSLNLRKTRKRKHSKFKNYEFFGHINRTRILRANSLLVIKGKIKEVIDEKSNCHF